MKRRTLAVWATALVLLVVAAYLLRRVRFDWAVFGAQLRDVRWWHVGVGVSLIYASFWLRSTRWALFCRSLKRVRAVDLLGPQIVGFTAVSLFGRLADLVRPYLLARRMELSLSSQIAVYTVERMFDLGAAAVVFSSALALTPPGMEHRDRFVKVGVASLGATLVLAVFAVLVRLHGDRVARSARRLLRRVSPRFADGVAEKVLEFQSGLRAVSTAGEFFLAALYSLLMWGMIGATYWQVAHAFARVPQLAGLSYSRTMLLMAVSVGGSLVQLPGVGWFTQIAALAAAMRGLYGASIEAATACAALLLLVTTLSIVPAGLVFASIEGVSLRGLARESKAAETA